MGVSGSNLVKTSCLGIFIGSAISILNLSLFAYDILPFCVFVFLCSCIFVFCVLPFNVLFSSSQDSQGASACCGYNEWLHTSSLLASVSFDMCSSF